MPKVVWTFHLPEEAEQEREHRDGPLAFSVLREMAEWLRRESKDDDVETIETERVRDQFFGFMEEHGVEL